MTIQSSLSWNCMHPHPKASMKTLYLYFYNKLSYSFSAMNKEYQIPNLQTSAMNLENLHYAIAMESQRNNKHKLEQKLLELKNQTSQLLLHAEITTNTHKEMKNDIIQKNKKINSLENQLHFAKMRLQNFKKSDTMDRSTSTDEPPKKVIKLSEQESKSTESDDELLNFTEALEHVDGIENDNRNQGKTHIICLYLDKYIPKSCHSLTQVHIA